MIVIFSGDSGFEEEEEEEEEEEGEGAEVFSNGLWLSLSKVVLSQGMRNFNKNKKR